MWLLAINFIANYLLSIYLSHNLIIIEPIYLLGYFQMVRHLLYNIPKFIFLLTSYSWYYFGMVLAVRAGRVFACCMSPPPPCQARYLA